ncbi:serine/threonine-protein kinase [Sphaerisporangium fuscum]|uniref:serine/threonine-protein kinase n=1 Tax=Sphaerisporangium fuscum TaxID=2835868 RepID=UPI001BDD19EE|nr:serine/threonine-protein kinase [Sphaerisporangium fuscum]
MDRSGAEPLRPDDPEHIGPYRLLGRLGQGGMGTVYLAEAPTGRQVAVKVVKAQLTVDEGFAVRFHAEVTNARRVASFCTAQVLDNGNAEDGRPYMVTEYIAGTPLSRQISRYGALEAGTLHGVALGVAAALAAIHVAGLVHRDLKPANVILSMSGPRVIDFGIARALDASQGVTRSGELLGTPGWWAPEQVRGEEISPAADVFAWGCLVAYAGNGRHPFGRGDMLALASRVLAGRPDLGTLPAPLDRLVRLATDPEPARRPSAQDLLIALVGGEIARPASPAVPVDPPTLVATEVLHESWEPPANVAAAVPGTTIIDPASPEVETPPVLTARTGTPLAARAEPGPADVPVDVRAESRPRGPDVPVDRRGMPAAGNAGEDTRPPADTSVTTMPSPAEVPPPSRSRRWLLPALTVAAGLLVTAGVLVMVSPGGRPPVRATGVAAVTAPAASPGPDVGRRFAASGFPDGPQFVVPRPARCGLTSYQGAPAPQGRLCVIGWTLLNPGGEQAATGGESPVLVDDRGGEHRPLSSASVPESLAPGGRADGVLFYDLPSGRGAATLKVRFSGSTAIEVRL